MVKSSSNGHISSMDYDSTATAGVTEFVILTCTEQPRAKNDNSNGTTRQVGIAEFMMSNKVKQPTHRNDQQVRN